MKPTGGLVSSRTDSTWPRAGMGMLVPLPHPLHACTPTATHKHGTTLGEIDIALGIWGPGRVPEAACPSVSWDVNGNSNSWSLPGLSLLPFSLSLSVSAFSLPLLLFLSPLSLLLSLSPSISLSLYLISVSVSTSLPTLSTTVFFPPCSLHFCPLPEDPHPACAGFLWALALPTSTPGSLSLVPATLLAPDRYHQGSVPSLRWICTLLGVQEQVRRVCVLGRV